MTDNTEPAKIDERKWVGIRAEYKTLLLQLGGYESSDTPEGRKENLHYKGKPNHYFKDTVTAYNFALSLGIKNVSTTEQLSSIPWDGGIKKYWEPSAFDPDLDMTDVIKSLYPGSNMGPNLMISKLADKGWELINQNIIDNGSLSIDKLNV